MYLKWRYIQAGGGRVGRRRAILHQVAGEGFCDKGTLEQKPAGNEGSPKFMMQFARVNGIYTLWKPVYPN